MAKEVRYILLEPHEAEQAVLRFLLARGLTLGRRAVEAARIEFRQGKAEGLVVLVEWTDSATGQAQARRMDETELLAAVLTWCRSARVPLPRRGVKGLERLGDSLALTMTLNASRTDARVGDHRIRYADPTLDAVPAPG